jgi:Stress responsive A/B Barrel Domain
VIERVVLVKLKPEFASDEQRAELARATASTLPDAEGVRSLRVGTPADGRTRREWDLVIEVVLDDLDAVERYRVDRVHRAYADVLLKPMLDKIRVYNFERFEPAQGFSIRSTA